MLIIYYYIKDLFTLCTVLLPLQALGSIILVLILPFIGKDKEHLPRCFRYFDNAEYYFKEKIWGVEELLRIGYKESELILISRLDGLAGPYRYREERGIYPVAHYSYFKLLYNRYVWLAWRNPVNYFKYAVLGFKLEGETILRHEIGDTEVNTGVDSPRGLYFVIAEVEGKTRHQVKYVKEYNLKVRIPALKIDFTRRLAFRLRFGHKFDSKDLTDPTKRGTIRQWVFNIHPFKKIN